MTYTTTTEAKAFTCPIARVSGEKEPKAKCRADDCILWRWKPVNVTDHRYKSALTREIALVKGEHKGDKEMSDHMAHKIATQNLAANIDGYIIRSDDDRGWCGLGSKPEG